MSKNKENIKSHSSEGDTVWRVLEFVLFVLFHIILIIFLYSDTLFDINLLILMKDISLCWIISGSEALIALYAGIAFFLPSVFWAWLRNVLKKYETQWWVPGKGIHKLKNDWDSVHQILMQDPLDYPRKRSFNFKNLSFYYDYALRDFLTIIGSFYAYGFFLKMGPADFTFFMHNLIRSGGSSNGFPLIIGFATAAIAALVVFLQFRASVKSANRQNWIADLRQTMASILENLPESGELEILKDNDWYKDEKLRNKKEKMGRSVWLFEMMMNPSEKDHRTLVTLVRLLGSPYWFYDPFDKGQVLDVDQIVLEKMKGWELDGLDAEGAYKPQGRDKILNYTIRLFQAVLKKEWERVKQGK